MSVEAGEFMFVGIGAAEGGLLALQDFFKLVPLNSQMAYLVMMFRLGDEESDLTTGLQKVTALPILQVTGKTDIKADHIYLVPSDQHLSFGPDFLDSSESLHLEEKRAPIDLFFRKLADQHGPRAISVILSGNGAHGSMGLKRIKENGGATYVQNPREAAFNEMPRNAIATELVDEVLNAGEIPMQLLSYHNNIGKVEIIETSEERLEPQRKALREIFTQIRMRTGHDFSNYKRPTLLRRIERRINVHNLPDLDSYVVFLHEQPNETIALLKDLLISVTNFFRDTKAFAGLEANVLPELFAGKHSGDEVRIWVAGCATGEEAYSLAILCAEQLMNNPDPPKVQIFATDIDEAAIATAREGCYTINDAADVSTERLRRFFTPEGDDYRIKKEIREMVLFANHNFLKDPPFSKLDLVTCRNVLIYLNSTAQSRVIRTFHFALNPKGYLFLGTSESIDVALELYTINSREHHIFQSKEVALRSYPVPDSLPQSLFNTTAAPVKLQEKENTQRPSFVELHQHLLEQYAPPSVVVDENYDIVHLSDKAGKYFELPSGTPTKNILKLVRPQMRLELRAALFQAVHHKTPIEARNIPLVLDGQPHPIDIHVRPAFETDASAKGLILVIFKPSQDQTATAAQIVASEVPVARQLEEELIGLKTQLRNSEETHEYQAEELKASNEELQAMNEELRSAAEELETSREELQSMNEELRTVNQELKVKIEETSTTTNNLQNLINSANAGTIFLDRSFAIRLFTPAILEVFNLKAGDYGRPITDITNKLQYGNLLNDAMEVLEKLIIVEREILTNDNRHFMMQLLPYRTADDRINGVVITFFDITKRKESEEALRQSEEKYRKKLEQEVELRTTELKKSKEQYATLIENTPDIVTRWDKNYQLIFANAALGNTIDITNTALIAEASLKKAFDTGEIVEHLSSLTTAKGEKYFYSKLRPEKDESGEISSVLVISRDITEIKQAETDLKESRDLLQSILDNSFIAMSVMKPVRNDAGVVYDFEIQLANLELTKETGRTDLLGKRYLEEYPGVRQVGLFEIMLRVIETGKPEGLEYYYPFEGFDKWYSCMFVKLGDAVLATNLDVSERKKAEDTLRKSEERLRMFVTASSDMIFQMNADWSELYAMRSNNFLSNIDAPAEDWMSRYIPPEDWKKLEDTINHAIAHKQVYELEHRVVLADGKIGWAYSRAVPLFDADRNIVEWFGIASNITDRKSFEAEYDKNYLLLRQSEEVAGTGTWDYNVLSGVINWSEGMYRLFELKKGAIVGPDVYVTYAASGQQEIALRITNNIMEAKNDFEESLIVDIDGVRKVLKTKATVVFDADSNPLRVLGVDMDITLSTLAEERVRMLESEQQLEIFRVTLTTQEEERRRISENLHNGLAQLLFGIKISINELSPELAERDKNAFVQSKKYTEKLLSTAISESRRISHELMPMLLDEFGLETAIKDICQQVKDAVQFQCKVSLAGITLDKYFELAVYRTVQELVINVVKHAEANSGKIKILIKENRIMIRVSDNGKGMKLDPDKMPGIGLASIRNKANALNGSVSVNSSAEEGTVVEVWLVIDAHKTPEDH
jgi:chemotaxis methyl-accepting protein methylase/signal transduction histidine kinase/PAS domain-containing protein